MIGRCCLAVVIALACLDASRADEAVRRDGSHVSGTLSLAESGRFVFRSAERSEPIAAIESVRFAPKSPAWSPVALWHQVHLVNGDTILGDVRKLGATSLHVRTAWADERAIPRSAIERVMNAPLVRPVFFDSFDGDLSAWSTTGNPRTMAGNLVLNRSGQAVEAKLKTPLPAGRIVVGFRSGRPSALRILLELSLERDKKPAPIRLELTGPAEHYAIKSPATATREGRLLREAGRHRVDIEFDRDRLRVFVDDLVLWVQQGAGELHAIRFLAEGEGSDAAEIEAVAIAKPEPSRERRPWADLTADAIRSPDGDETFGELSSAGPRGLTLGVKGKRLPRGWPEVAEFAFRRTAVTEHATAGEHVRVRIHSFEGAHDVLAGAVKALTGKDLVLTHPLLGELTIPRDRLEELRLLFHGRSIPIDATPRHLGERAGFGFAVPKPEGLRFAKAIELKAPASDGFVIVDAAHVRRTGTPVAVRVNGTSTGELNRSADRDDGHVHAYRLPFPAMPAGELEVEVQVRPPAGGGRVNGIDLRALRLELHDAR